MSSTGRPESTEYDPFYDGYVSLVPEDDVLSALEGQIVRVAAAASAVSPDREPFRYAPDKWSVRQVFGHLGDSERTLGYRAFAISRQDQQSLPGMEETSYVDNAPFERFGVRELAEELIDLRRANVAMLRRVEPPLWSQVGVANGNEVSLRALAYIMVGHIRHHLGVLRERYELEV